MNMKKLKRLRAVLLLLCSFVAPITMLAQDLVIPVGETGNLPLNSNHVWASSDGSGRYTHWEIDNGSKQYIRILSQSVTSVTLQGVSPTLNTLALVRSTHIWTDPWGRSQSLTGAYYVKVSPKTPSIIISAKEVEMTVGETETISVTVNTYGVNYDDRWSVENGTDNVTLTDYGLYATVKAVKPGVCTVRYTLGSFPEAYGISCKITIKEAEKPKLTLSASPFGGEVTAGTQVYLSANVSGADIYYTLDGSTPSKSSSRYTSSGITINESCTLKAIAYKDGYETSEVLTQTYTVKINGVVINSTNFPDETFRIYLLSQDYGVDEIITDDEISEIKEIEIQGENITTLKGLEYFVALEKLDCGYNQLTRLDVSKNTKLKKLYCGANQLTTLNVSKNPELERLECYRNRIGKLAMGSLVNSLPFSQEEKYFVVVEDSNDEKNVCTAEHVGICREKSWIPQQLIWVVVNEYLHMGFYEDYEGSESTDIQHLYMDGMDMDNKTFYDLKGRRITKPTAKGLYIKNGKKIIFK